MLARRIFERSLAFCPLLMPAYAADNIEEYAVITQAEEDLPSWASSNILQLNMSTDANNYALIPLTENLGLGGSSGDRREINLEGWIKTARSSNYKRINDSLDVAYMCCDESDNHNSIDRSKMLNELMEVGPKAIVLYSTARNWCSISYEQELPYDNILSMVDPGEAIAVVNHLNETDEEVNVRVSITGNTTSLESDSSEHTSGSQSSVAMSVLYSITGIITLLFVVIITTGAIRAHRYPDRYGPRRAHGGRGRQSRAKGLAMAVLETLPVVKFGDRQQSKPDPDFDMETATTDGQDVQRAASHSSEPQVDPTTGASSRASSRAQPSTGDQADDQDPQDQSPGCSICTDDFKVGEDVRVLPCNHQYHPACIDPWLINVSGTCPLCRLDLQPGRGRGDANSPAEGGNTLPPPLTLEREDSDAGQTSYRIRLSRMFDVNQFQESSREEQMAAIRQLRDHAANVQGSETGPQVGEERSSHHSAGFADRLRDRFRILTRSQSAQRREC